MGIAPLVYLADRLVRLSCDVNVLYGAETASELVALDKLQQEGAKCHIATMDGSRGYKGLVTDLLTCISEGEPTRMSTGKQARTDIVYSCGPLEMMAHVAKFAKEQAFRGSVVGVVWPAGGCVSWVRIEAQKRRCKLQGAVTARSSPWLRWSLGQGRGRCGNES